MPVSCKRWFSLLCLMLGFASQTHAATFTVNSTDSVAAGACDAAHCSITRIWGAGTNIVATRVR